MKAVNFLICFSIFSNTFLCQTVSTLVPNNVGDDMHFSIDGYIYSSHYGGYHFRKIDPSTGIVDTIMTVNTPTIGAIEMDDDLNIYTCSYDLGWVGKFKEGDSTILFVASGLSGPAGIVLNDEGNLFVATNQNHSIIKIYPDGTKETYFYGSPLFWPTGIAIDPSNNLYVANMFSGEIIKITTNQEASVLTTLPAIADQIPDLAYLVWTNGHLYVCHFGDHVIYEVDPISGETEIIAGTGTAGQNNGTALSATFQNPTGIASSPSGDTLFVTDGVAPNQRLRMIVFNTISGTQLSKEQGFLFQRLFPNPANDKLILNFALEKSMKLSFQIVDASGKVYTTKKAKKYNADHHRLEFDLSNLAKGEWFLVARTDQFTKSFNFLKN